MGTNYYEYKSNMRPDVKFIIKNNYKQKQNKTKKISIKTMNLLMKCLIIFYQSEEIFTKEIHIEMIFIIGLIN